MTEQQAKTAGVAVASLILGILGLMCVGPFGAIPAVICGHIGLSKIKKSEGALQGGGLAIGGLVTGYIGIAMLPLLAAIAVPSFVRARNTSQQHVCINNMRMIDSAKEQWALANKKSAGDEVDTAEANQYIRMAVTPPCPTGGQYDYRPIGENPECSQHGSLGDAY